MWKANKIEGTTLEEKIKNAFLRNVQKESLEEVNDWFRKSYADEWHIDGLEQAVELVLPFKDRPVHIIGDYDVDGVTSSSILFLALKRTGFNNVTCRIPKRFSEGFGINLTIIDEIKDDGLIITCDNGVAQPDAIKAAKDKGLTVLIIDHHEPIIGEDGNPVYPEADLIIDPNAIKDSADFNGYCGAGLSYRFAKTLLTKAGDAAFAQCLIGLAALGTVADVMELTNENYVIVRNGIKKLLDSRYNTAGLNALIAATTGKYITANDIGFKIGPAINAASRLRDDGAMFVFRLLTFNGNMPTAISLAEELVELNDKRKAYKYQALRMANEEMKEKCLYGNIPLILNLPGVPEGIIGIIAGNLCEKYKTPAIILTETEPGVLKGSARCCDAANGSVNIKEELDKLAEKKPECLIRYGGHAGAAGLSVSKEHFDVFCETLYEQLDWFEPVSDEDKTYDIEIDVSEISQALTEIAKYEPFGNGNERITFLVRNFSVIPFRGKYFAKLGDAGSIIKLSGNYADAMGFDMAEHFQGVQTLDKVDLIGKLAMNYYNGELKPQIEFVDFRICEPEAVKTPLAAKLAAMALSTTS